MPTFNQLVRKGRQTAVKKSTAPALLDCFICIDGDSSIILQMFIEDSFILTITLLNVFFYFLIRTSVCQTELPVRVSLCTYRIYQFLQIWYRCTVQRNHNTDQRILRKMCMALSAKSLSVRFMTIKPFFISSLCSPFLSLRKRRPQKLFAFSLSFCSLRRAFISISYVLVVESPQK